MRAGLTDWGLSILRGPGGRQILHVRGDVLVDDDGMETARLENGIVRFPIASPDQSIAFYRQLGGAHFQERAGVAFAMSVLDTPVYHELLGQVRPNSKDDVIVDVGGGDGRNARPWLEQGFKRVVVVDAVGDALVRFRERIAKESVDWLDRVLLIEADARAMPLANACAAAVVAIEALYYLNEDYEIGLEEALRTLCGGGLLLVSERDYEAAILSRLLYDGLAEMLETASSHAMWDTSGSARVRTRTFTEEELVGLIQASGATVVSVRGIPFMPLVTGWKRQHGMIGESDEALIPRINQMLSGLSATGRLRRCHVITARREPTRS